MSVSSTLTKDLAIRVLTAAIYWRLHAWRC